MLMASDVMKSITAMNKSMNSASIQSDASFHCDSGYLMNALGLFLQFLLAVLAFTSLIGKCKQYSPVLVPRLECPCTQ